ncbi:hypothetical protein CLAIMM_12108 isoform 1, partial [Cladophialophora immunda]
KKRREEEMDSQNTLTRGWFRKSQPWKVGSQARPNASQLVRTEGKKGQEGQEGPGKPVTLVSFAGDGRAVPSTPSTYARCVRLRMTSAVTKCDGDAARYVPLAGIQRRGPLSWG